MRVLIGYASRCGSTKEIAERIAATLHGRGLTVDVREASQLADLRPYDAIVIGSGVYDGSWAPAADALLCKHAAILAEKPVWLFSVGSFGDSHPVVGRLMRKEPKGIEEFERRIHPRDYRVFAGIIDLEQWPAWGRLVFKGLGGRSGDNRHWPEIDAWAEEIALAIRAPH
jgi:menaquinone-dependent protoporphyrinogen oxidase